VKAPENLQTPSIQAIPEASWRNPKVQSLFDDLTLNGKNAGNLEKCAFYGTIVHFVSVYLHSPTGLRVVRKDINLDCVLPYEIIAAIRQLSELKPEGIVPVMALPGSDSVYYELDLKPLGYVTLGSVVVRRAGLPQDVRVIKPIKSNLSDSEKTLILQTVIKNLKSGEIVFIHGDLHPCNIMVKTDSQGTITDVK
jgi:hypothetical protein